MGSATIRRCSAEAAEPSGSAAGAWPNGTERLRGQQERSGPLFCSIATEDRIPKGHPLRQVRRLADQALDRLNPTFFRLYQEGGRPSIPPEQWLLALLLQAIYAIGSGRILSEQLVSSEHVSVDGTLLRASASHSSLARIDSSHGEARLCHSSAIDGRTIGHQGCARSINAKRRIEQVFGLIKIGSAFPCRSKPFIRESTETPHHRQAVIQETITNRSYLFQYIFHLGY